MGTARRPAVPAIYGRYQTLFRIAAGGMAEVYAARVQGEAGFQKLVALKRMLPHLTDDERFVTMFMDEGKLAANIESPNVVSTLDLGRADDGSLYLVMELVVGTTLSTLLRNAAKAGESVPTDVACEIIAQAAQGLHDAHEARTPFGAPLELVHRDVSPQNILVGVDGRVRITDFGVARAVLRRTKTSTGEFKGKLSYFSPEQCADHDLDRRSDLFSLGVVAWETLTTRRLFHAENPLAVLERVTRMPIPSPHVVQADIPRGIADVVSKALERNREARQSSALAFSHALRAAARESFGPPDRSAITDLVERFGGEQLEHMQLQLKQSLANPTGIPSPSEPPEDWGEDSSGIVIRPDEMGPATPRQEPSESLPRLEYAPDRTLDRSRAQRKRLILASVVSLVAVLVGATAGLWLTDEPDPPVVNLPAEVSDPPPTGQPPSPGEAGDETRGTDEPDPPVVNLPPEVGDPPPTGQPPSPGAAGDDTPDSEETQGTGGTQGARGPGTTARDGLTTRRRRGASRRAASRRAPREGGRAEEPEDRPEPAGASDPPPDRAQATADPPPRDPARPPRQTEPDPDPPPRNEGTGIIGEWGAWGQD